MINNIIDADFIVNVENNDDIWKYKDKDKTDYNILYYFFILTL